MMKPRKIFSIFLFAAVFAAERWIAPDKTILLPNTPQLKTKIFENPKQLLREIQNIKRHSFAVADNTSQQMSSNFAKVLLNRLPSSEFKTKMTKKSKIYSKEWRPKSQEHFELLLGEYFTMVDKKADSIGEIINAAKELGQIHRDGSNTETNAFKAKYVGELAKSFDAESNQMLLPKTNDRLENLQWIQKQFSQNQASIEVFHINEKFLGITKESPKDISELKEETDLQGEEDAFDVSGSLNTYMDDKDDFELLKQLKSWANGIVDEDAELSIAQRIYLIWKTKGYTTIDHQDVHQKQHLVSYHQMKGKAFFHLLPPICGLYVAHLYKEQNLAKLEKTLAYFDENKIGGYTYLERGEIIFLPPDKTHFVQVPYSNEKQVDYVRAYEILFDYQKMENSLISKKANVCARYENADEIQDSENSTACSKDFEDWENWEDWEDWEDSEDATVLKKNNILRMPSKEKTLGETYILKQLHLGRKRNCLYRLHVQGKHLCSFHSAEVAEEAIEILKPIRERLSKQKAFSLIDAALDNEVRYRLKETSDLYRDMYATRKNPAIKLQRLDFTLIMPFNGYHNFENARYEVLKYSIKNGDGNRFRQSNQKYKTDLENILRKHKLIDKKEVLKNNYTLNMKQRGKMHHVLKNLEGTIASFGAFADQEDAKNVRDELELDLVKSWPEYWDLLRLKKTKKYEMFVKLEELKQYQKKLENLRNPESKTNIKLQHNGTYQVRMQLPPNPCHSFGSYKSRAEAKNISVRVLEIYTNRLVNIIKGNKAREPMTNEDIETILTKESAEKSKGISELDGSEGERKVDQTKRKRKQKYSK